MKVKRTKDEASASSQTNRSCHTDDTDVEIPVLFTHEPGKVKEFDVMTLRTRFDVDNLRRVDPFMYFSIFKFDHETDCLLSLLKQNSAGDGSDTVVKVSRRSRLSTERDAVTDMCQFMSELDA